MDQVGSINQPDDGGSLDPLDVALRTPFSSSETPTTTTTSLPTPQSSYPFLSDTQNAVCSSLTSRYDTLSGWDLGPTQPPPAPVIKDMDSFGEGSAKGSFDFSLRSASSTEQLSQSFSSLLSLSQPSRVRASEISDPPAVSGLHSITEGTAEGAEPEGTLEFNVLPPTPTDAVLNPTPYKPQSVSVAFSLEDPSRSIEIWRDDVLTSTLSADGDAGAAAVEFEGSVGIVTNAAALYPRALKRHISLLSVETEYERRKQARQRSSFFSRMSTFSSAGSSAGGSPGALNLEDTFMTALDRPLVLTAHSSTATLF
jgi:hypothetical protein